MIVSRVVGKNLYVLKNNKIYNVKETGFWGIVLSAVVVGLKEFFEKI